MHQKHHATFEVDQDQKIEKDEVYEKEYQRILSTKRFAILFMILAYILGMPAFFLINIKNFGLIYYSDLTLTNLSLLMAAVAFCSRIGSGHAVDLWGTINVFKKLILMTSVIVGMF